MTAMPSPEVYGRRRGAGGEPTSGPTLSARHLRLALVALMALGIVADCLTTWHAVAHGGREVNPLNVALFGAVGPYLGMAAVSAAKAAVIGVVVWLARRERAFAVLFPVLIVACWHAPVHNLFA